MSLIAVLCACLVLMLISLAVVSLINRHQARRRERKSILHSLQRRISEQEELCTAIEPLLETTEILRLLNTESIRLLERIVALDPDARQFALRLERAEQMDLELAQRRHPRQLNRLLESDLAMAKSKYSLTVAVRQLRAMQSQGFFDLAKLDAFLDDLAWAQLMVTVVSFVGHGHKAANQGDSTIALTFYRKAQNMLMNAQVRDPRRLRCMEELADIIALKRPALSPELMPETRHNPRRSPRPDHDSGSSESDKSDRGSRSA